MSQNIQTMMMPVAMTIGFIFHKTIGRLDFLTPYLIFTMLFIPFCSIRLKDMKITGLHINLLLFQCVMSILAYSVIQLFDPVLAQGAMICIIAPTATAAVVIARMLGGKVSTMLSYSLLVNVVVAIGAPIFFSIISPVSDVSFWHSFIAILEHVMPVLILPFIAAILLRRFAPKVTDAIQQVQSLSFYLWLVALSVVTA